MSGKRHRAFLKDEYEQLLEGVTIDALAGLFPSNKWKRFKRRGWTSLRLRQSEVEERFLQLSSNVAMAELGVDPADPSTYSGPVARPSLRLWLQS